MYICNMLGKDGVKSYNNGKVVISNEESVVEGYFTVKDGKVVETESEGENIFLSWYNTEKESSLYRVGKPNGRKGNLTYSIVKDTPENPLIVVLCKEIGVFEGIEADIRYINLSDDTILAMLVSGACTFDGNPMQRCNTMSFENRTIYNYSAEKLRDLSDNLFTEKNSNYVYSKDIICSVLLNHESDVSFSVKRVGEPYFIDKSGYDKAVADFKVLQEQKEREEQQRKIEKALREERVKADMAAKQAEEKAKKEKKVKDALSKASVKKEEKSNLGASDFLAAVRAMQGGN